MTATPSPVFDLEAHLSETNIICPPTPSRRRSINLNFKGLAYTAFNHLRYRSQRSRIVIDGSATPKPTPARVDNIGDGLGIGTVETPVGKAEMSISDGLNPSSETESVSDEEALSVVYDSGYYTPDGSTPLGLGLEYPSSRLRCGLDGSDTAEGAASSATIHTQPCSDGPKFNHSTAASQVSSGKGSTEMVADGSEQLASINEAHVHFIVALSDINDVNLAFTGGLQSIRLIGSKTPYPQGGSPVSSASQSSACLEASPGNEDVPVEIIASNVWKSLWPDWQWLYRSPTVMSYHPLFVVTTFPNLPSHAMFLYPLSTFRFLVSHIHT